MTQFDAVFFNRGLEAIGWTLLHFVWQGTLAAALYGILKVILRRAAARVRYGAACLTLLVLSVMPVLTLSGNFPLPWHRVPVVGGHHPQSEAELFHFPALASHEGIDSPVPEDTTHSTQSPALGWKVQLENVCAPALPWLVWLWLGGVLLLLVRLGGGWWITRRLLRTGLQPITAEWRDRLTDLKTRMGVTQAVALYESLTVESPTVIGWLRPVILLPTAALTGLSTSQLEAILAHELAHIRRWDYAVNWLQTLAETLLFYHPAVWWISHDIRTEREYCCDDIAVQATGNPIVFARGLTNLEQFRQTGSPTRLLLAANGGPFMKRIERLLLPRPAAASLTRFSLASSLVCLTFMLLLLGAALRPAVTLNAAAQEAAKKRARSVAVGFVALPIRNAAIPTSADGEQTARMLIEELKANRIPAIGYVQGSRVAADPESMTRQLRWWRDAGLELGLGSYSHKWFFGTPYEEYEADVVKNEDVVRPLLAERGQVIRHYSYPFLNTGPDMATKERFEKFLKQRGYALSPFTIDNDDWFFAKTYDEARAKGDTETMQKVKAEYVPYMRRMFEFYEQYSQELLGQEVPQVLLLTPSRLNADAMGELLGMLRERGYRFVSLDQATSDPAYATRDTYTGKTGISWLQRWGMSQGWQWREEPHPGGYMEQFNYHQGAGNLKAKK
ncbi:MAG: polysaccharide deacetylase family protein [Blastocatellia bacterium]|nr:polysaccharide deacetylase family protein [Blastocatellia bacterium]